MTAGLIIRAVELAIVRLRGPLARQSTAIFFLRILNIALGVTTTFILGRTLGVDGFGVFSVGFACATLLSGLFQASFSTHIMQTTASALAGHNWPSLNGIRNFSLCVAAASSVAAYAIMAGAFVFVDFDTASPVVRAMILGALITPVLFFDAAASALLQGLSKLACAFIPQFAIAQTSFLVFTIVAVISDSLTPESALVLFGASWLLAACTSWLWRWRYWPKAARPYPGAIQAKEWAAKSASILFAGLPNIVFGRLEVMLLAMISGPTAAGIYALAFRFAQFATLPSFATASGLGPAVSSFSAKGMWQAALDRIHTATRYTTLLTVMFAAALQALVIILFPVIHPDFASASFLVGVIAIGYIVQAAAGRPLLLLIIKNKMSAAAIIGVCSVCCGTLVAAVLIHFSGALGAAATTALINSAIAITLCCILWRQCKLRGDLFVNASPQLHPTAPAHTPTHKAAE